MLTLGFFKDECSDTSLLFLSSSERADLISQNRGRGPDREGIKLYDVGKIVMIMAVFITLFAAVYCCLKRRGKICKKRQAGARLEQDSINHLDMTPAKAVP